MKNYIKDFFEEIAFIMDILNIHNSSPRIDPFILLVISLILSFQASFTTNIAGLIIPLMYSIVLIIVLKPDWRTIAKIELFVYILSLIVSLPLLFTDTGSINSFYELRTNISPAGIYSFTKLLARITVSPLPLLVAITYLGWPNTMEAIARFTILRTTASYLALTIVLIPRIIRYSIQLLIAREARIVKNKYLNIWKSLSTVIGDLIIHSNSYANKIQYAYVARNISKFKTYRRKTRINKATAVFTMLSILIIIAEAVVMLYGSY